MVLVPTLRHKLFENPIFYLRMADKVWNPILKVYVLVKNIYCNYIIIRYSFFTFNLFKKSKLLKCSYKDLIQMKNFMIALKLSCFLAFSANAEIVIKDAFAIKSVPTAKSGAIFMIIHNQSDSEEYLLSARTEISKMAHLHTHKMIDDVMKMIHVKNGFKIPAKSMLHLARGGHHIMLMGIDKSLNKHETFDLNLKFKNAGNITTKVIYHGAGMKENSETHDH